MINDLPPEPIRLPSPDEILAERDALLASAQAKLMKLGLTIDEAKAVTGL